MASRAAQRRPWAGVGESDEAKAARWLCGRVGGGELSVKVVDEAGGFVGGGGIRQVGPQRCCCSREQVKSPYCVREYAGRSFGSGRL